MSANTSTKATMNRAAKPSSKPKMLLILFSPRRRNGGAVPAGRARQKLPPHP
jgi:hypothetical protein